MELNQYIKLLKKNTLFILVLSVLGLTLATFMTKSLPSGFGQTQTFYINAPIIQDEENSAFFTQERARNFTDSAVSILESSDFKNEVLLSPGQAISAKKTAPQIIQISSSAQNSNDAQALMQKSVKTFNSKLVQFSQSQSPMQIQPVGQPQNPAEIVVNTKIFSLFCLLLGFAFSFLALSL